MNFIRRGALGELEQSGPVAPVFVDPYGNPISVPEPGDQEHAPSRAAYEEFWQDHVIIRAPEMFQGSGEDVEARRLAQELYDSLPQRVRDTGAVVVSNIADLREVPPELEVISFAAPYAPAVVSAGVATPEGPRAPIAPVFVDPNPGAVLPGGVGPVYVDPPARGESVIDTSPALANYANPLANYFPGVVMDDGGSPPRTAAPAAEPATDTRRALLIGASILALLLS